MLRFTRTLASLPLPLLLVLGVAGCMDPAVPATDVPRPATQSGPATSEALVMSEAPEAIAAAVDALAGFNPRAEAQWTACMAQPVWRYEGWATFSAPRQDRKTQLDAVRVALLAAGYTDTTRVDDKVSVERGGFAFVVGPTVPARDGTPRWKATFWSSPCQRYSAAERAYIKTSRARRDVIAMHDQE